MKNIIGIVAVTLATITSAVASTQTDMHKSAGTAAQDSWDRVISLEPCMNGGVSASGLYPSQIAENMSFSSRGLMASRPPD